MNGDGKLDLVIQYRTNPITVSTFTNDGNGNFTLWATTQFPPSQFGEISALAQFNADTRPDLVANNYYYALQPNGTFSAGIHFDGQVIGDFNGDGKADAAYATAITGEFRLYTLINNGTGTSFQTTFVPVPVIELIRTLDVNNDGKADIIARTQGSGGPYKLYIFLRNNSGGFTQTEYLLPDVVETLDRVSPADFNGDGKLDLALTITFNNNGINDSIVYYGDGIGGFTQRIFSRLGGLNLFADFDGDGRSDYVEITSSPYFPTVASVYLKKGICSPPSNTKITDFDGDGRTDLTMWRPSDGRWTIRTGYNTVTTFFWGAGGLGDVPTPGDFDGDGKTDIAVWRNTNGIWYLRRSSDNAFQYVQWGATSDKPVPGDYDGDGQTDVAVYRPSNGIWCINQSSNGQFYAVSFGIAEDKPVPADYDGDGKTDTAVFRPSTGTWYILKSSDGGVLIVRWGTNGDKPVPGDYDANGKTDVAVFRPSNGYWYLRSSGNDSFFSFQFGDTEDFAVPGTYDYNFDLTQVAVYRSSERRWYTNNFGTEYNIISLGETGEIPVSSLPRVE